MKNEDEAMMKEFVQMVDSGITPPPAMMAAIADILRNNPCPHCNGDGMDPQNDDLPCPLCGGSGFKRTSNSS